MLDDATDAFLESVTERGFDQPFLALLRSRGYSNAHLTHGAQEFGKDFVARKGGQQWAFQSKAGDVGQPEWRDIRGQVDELRLSDYGGPEFDPDLPRHPVLVITGRLVGNAPLLASEYNRQARHRGEPEVEIWGRDRLLADLSGEPDAALRGSIDGQLLSVLGASDRRDISMDVVEEFSRRWEAFPPDELLGLGVIEAGIVCDRLWRAERLDLACHTALQLVRAAWAGDHGDDQTEAAAQAGRSLFDTYARKLWNECDHRLLRKRGLVGYSGFAAWVTYPIRCLRVAEILGLFGLRLRETDPEEGDRIAIWLAKFVRAQPGISHPPGDRYAVSLIPPALLLKRSEPGASRRLLKNAAIWMCDRYERFSFGLAPPGAPAQEEIERVFGDMFEYVLMRRRRQSLLAGVLLDTCAALRHVQLYADIRNDQLAVEATPMVLRCPDTRDQYSHDSLKNLWELNPAYPNKLPKRADAPIGGLMHHGADAEERRALRENKPWDLLAVSSALRDRHFVGAIRRLA